MIPIEAPKPRPYTYASPIDEGHIDPNYYNLFNFDVAGYWEGSYYDSEVNPHVRTHHSHANRAPAIEPAKRVQHPWWND